MLKIIALAAAALAMLLGLGFVIDSDSRSPTAVHEARQRPDVICAPGRVEGVDEELELRAQLADRVLEIKVVEGDFVEAGAVLLTLDGTVQRHELDLAQADLASAEADLERLVNGARPEERREADAELKVLQARLVGARQRRERSIDLRDKNAGSEQQLDDATTDVKVFSGQVDAAQARCDLLEAPARDDEVRRARARIAVALARLELAKHHLEQTSLRALSRAQVLQIGPAPGELVGPDDVRPAVVLADTSKWFARAFVDEFDAPRVRMGMLARVTADGLRGELRGRVVRLAPRMCNKQLWNDNPTERIDTKVREVWIELDEPGDLIVGLRVDVVLSELAE